MKSYLFVAGILSIGLLTVSAPVLAHHGNAAYADDFTEFKQATVTKFAWANPHALISFDAKDAKGGSITIIADGTMQEAALPNRFITGTWTQTSGGNTVKGDFRIRRQ